MGDDDGRDGEPGDERQAPGARRRRRGKRRALGGPQGQLQAGAGGDDGDQVRRVLEEADRAEELADPDQHCQRQHGGGEPARGAAEAGQQATTQCRPGGDPPGEEEGELGHPGEVGARAQHRPAGGTAALSPGGAPAA